MANDKFGKMKRLGAAGKRDHELRTDQGLKQLRKEKDPRKSKRTSRGR